MVEFPFYRLSITGRMMADLLTNSKSALIPWIQNIHCTHYQSIASLNIVEIMDTPERSLVADGSYVPYGVSIKALEYASTHTPFIHSDITVHIDTSQSLSQQIQELMRWLSVAERISMQKFPSTICVLISPTYIQHILTTNHSDHDARSKCKMIMELLCRYNKLTIPADPYHAPLSPWHQFAIILKNSLPDARNLLAKPPAFVFPSIPFYRERVIVESSALLRNWEEFTITDDSSRVDTNLAFIVDMGYYFNRLNYNPGSNTKQVVFQRPINGKYDNYYNDLECILGIFMVRNCYLGMLHKDDPLYQKGVQLFDHIPLTK